MRSRILRCTFCFSAILVFFLSSPGSVASFPSVSSIFSLQEKRAPVLGQNVLGKYQGEGQLQYWETSHGEAVGSTYTGSCKVGFNIHLDNQSLALPFMSYVCSNSWNTGNDRPVYGQIVNNEIFFGSKKIGKIDENGNVNLEFSETVIQYRDVVRQGADCTETIQRHVPFEYESILKLAISRLASGSYQVHREKSGRILRETYANMNRHCAPVAQISFVDYWSRVSSTLNPR